MIYVCCSVLIFFLLKKKLGFLNSLVIIFLNIFSIYYFYNFEFQYFKDDSSEYYNNTITIFNLYNINDLIFAIFSLNDYSNQLPVEVNNLFSKIYIFFYIVFIFFGNSPYSLAIFYLILKCITFIYLANFLKSYFISSNSRIYLLGFLLLLDPWTIYFQSFFF